MFDWFCLILRHPSFFLSSVEINHKEHNIQCVLFVLLVAQRLVVFWLAMKFFGGPSCSAAWMQGHMAVFFSLLTLKCEV